MRLPLAAGLGCTAVAASGYGTGVGGLPAAAVTGGLRDFPAMLTSFIGREEAVRDVAGLLGEYRLVTVTGPGGSGKTRLADQVARQMAGRFTDGAWLAGLATVRDPAQVAPVVAAALAIRSSRGCRRPGRWCGCWPGSSCCESLETKDR